MNSNQSLQNFGGYFPTWCPGCGNFGIWAAIKNAFSQLKILPEQMAVVFGIGCSGNMNDFLWVNSLHALHGRAIPNAIGIKIANHTLPVVVIAGDGDCYGEGGNHFIHACRGNHDITVIIHDNRVYGLTTGQVAPTAIEGFKAKSTPNGAIETSLNPLALALCAQATFVSQGFAGDILHLTDLIMRAITHKGFSLVNVFQPCVTFNKQTTYAWYRERIYKLTEENHNPTDFAAALSKAFETDQKLPIGILYQIEKPSYTNHLPQISKCPLASSDLTIDENSLLKEFE